MIKNILYTALLTFSSGASLLNNKASFHEIQKQNERTQFEYYTDYIDLYFFYDLNIEFLSVANNTINFFRITANVSKDKLLSTGVYDNTFKYFTPLLYLQNQGVNLSVDTENILDGDKYLISNNRLSDKVDKYGFALSTDIYDGYANAYNLISTSWLPFEMVDTQPNLLFEVLITIPYGNKSQPPADWQNLLKNNLRFVNQNYYDKFLLGLSANAYDKGYGDGVDDGYAEGYVDGNNDGIEIGYERGKTDGRDEALTADFNAYGWLTGIFSAMGALLSIQLLPNVSIGGILILIMVLTLLPFLIGLLKGGKD